MIVLIGGLPPDASVMPDAPGLPTAIILFKKCFLDWGVTDGILGTVFIVGGQHAAICKTALIGRVLVDYFETKNSPVVIATQNRSDRSHPDFQSNLLYLSGNGLLRAFRRIADTTIEARKRHSEFTVVVFDESALSC